MSNHTPIPWTLSKEGYNGEIWITDSNGNTAMAKVMHLRPEAEENAEMIVLSVNYHDRLLESLSVFVDCHNAGIPVTEQEVDEARSVLSELILPGVSAHNGGER